MTVLEQTRQRLVVRFGDALLPVFAAAACFILGLGALVAASAVGNLFVGAIGALLIIAGSLWMLRERHVTLSLDRVSRTLLIRRWKNLMPSGAFYRFEEIASYEVICNTRSSALGTALARLLPVRESQPCMLVANFPTGPDIILVRNLSPADAAEAKRLILMYIEP